MVAGRVVVVGMVLTPYLAAVFPQTLANVQPELEEADFSRMQAFFRALVYTHAV